LQAARAQRPEAFGARCRFLIGALELHSLGRTHVLAELLARVVLPTWRPPGARPAPNHHGHSARLPVQIAHSPGAKPLGREICDC